MRRGGGSGQGTCMGDHTIEEVRGPLGRLDGMGCWGRDGLGAAPPATRVNSRRRGSLGHAGAPQAGVSGYGVWASGAQVLGFWDGNRSGRGRGALPPQGRLGRVLCEFVDRSTWCWGTRSPGLWGLGDGNRASASVATHSRLNVGWGGHSFPRLQGTGA